MRIEIMDDFPECDELTGRSRQICRGEALTAEKQDAYRIRWGLTPRFTNATTGVADHQPQSVSSKKIKGLGDVVHAVTEATGIARVVKAVTKGKCGCENRREKLNQMFPFGGQQ